MIGHRTMYLAKPAERPRPELTWGDACGALVQGATVGAVLTAAPLTFVAGPLAIVLAVFAWPVWLWGLTCVGVPVWAVLHAGGVRDPRAAALIGAGLTFLVCVMLARDLGMGEGGFLSDPPTVEGALAAIGAVVGWVVFRSAYGPQTSRRTA